VTNDRATNNLDFFTNNVDYYSSEYRDFALKPWERRIVELVSGRDVLDVACGGGRVTVPLLRRGYNVTGTDFVKEFEQKIRQHESTFTGTFKFVTASMDSLPFPDNSFDSVTCINSIVYMKDSTGVEQTIKEMSRVLKHNGKLYFTSWNMWHPLWGTSILANYLLRRMKRFGETSPFFAMDKRAKHSGVSMFVSTKAELRRMCSDAGVHGKTYSSDEFTNNNGLLSRFKPIIVVAGVKR